MANVKSRLKAPKSASTKKKRGRKPKKSLAGPKKSEPKKRKNIESVNTEPAKASGEPQAQVSARNNIQLKKSDVVMKRPSSRKVMTPDEKVIFILKHGHKLKEKFITKPPAPVKPIIQQNELQVSAPPRPTIQVPESDLPQLSKSGRLKKKSKCDMTIIDSILKGELMIKERPNGKDMSPEPVPSSSPPPPRVDNNNDLALTNQNKTIHDLSDDEYQISEEMSVSSEEGSDNNCSNESSPDSGNKSKDKDSSYPKPRHIKLKNGVILNLLNFECDVCHRTFNRKCSLRRHMYIHLGMKPYNCRDCRQAFWNPHKLKDHINLYHNTNAEDTELFICNYCDKPFLVKENLQKHLDTHTKAENSFKCIYCNKVFGYHIMLMQHEKKHMVKGRHECTLCSMSFRCRNRLYMHVKSHLKLKDFICQYCGKEFLLHNSLRRHVEVCHGGHRIVCPICNKNLKGHLTEHMRTHEKKRPHVCPECGQRFTQSTQLNVHRRAHTGARPYPCRICKRFFSHSNALMLHIRRHTGEKPFPCPMCPMSFSQLPHMKTHMRKIHGKENPYKCSNCDSFYKLKAQLDVHSKTCTAAPAPTAETPAPEPAQGKKKKSKKAEDEIEVESSMTLSRMRFLLALLLTMIATKEKLKYLGFNKRLVDEILIESLEGMGRTPCKDNTLPPLKRLRRNIEMLLLKTVPRDQMEKFKKESKSIEDILELLTTEKDK
ncbi:zinc finger protein 572-like isoform X1 [Spodoptera litura]|uniref:Zinc finger protein 572-like isoform X1 n=2 Tax=Spodoptera litura TaxID=69820 RepID=A0A9J7ELF7_SPOLT|nr:zinc finger protein 572-like isoform X1 [Spodoptera litura]